VVAGAGPWGLAIAWRAAGAGASVVVVDDGGQPAAWVAAGMLGPWSEPTEGEEELHRLLVRSARAWPGFAAEVASAAGRDAGYVVSGAVLAAARPEHRALVSHRLRLLEAWGDRVEWLTGSALRGIEPGLGPAVSGGASLPDEHQVEPRALLAALRAACAQAGVTVVPGRVAAVRRAGGRASGVELEDGLMVEAGRVVIAAGWRSGSLGDAVAVRPVKGQILRARATPEAPLPIRRVVRTPSVYLAPRGDEVVIGATMEERGDRLVTVGGVHGLLDEALRVVPELAEIELAELAAGLRPTGPRGLPAIGTDPADGVVWATGGYRHGLLLLPVASEAGAALALGRPAPAWAEIAAAGVATTCASA
jgi:glycine oxidase